MKALPVLALTAGLLVGCGKSVGEPCEVEGDGFTRRDPCVEMCLDFAITCPDGREVVPMQCAGVVCGEGGACPEGQTCTVIDSFAANARCVMDAVCAPE